MLRQAPRPCPQEDSTQCTQLLSLLGPSGQGPSVYQVGCICHSHCLRDQIWCSSTPSTVGQNKALVAGSRGQRLRRSPTGLSPTHHGQEMSPFDLGTRVGNPGIRVVGGRLEHSISVLHAAKPGSIPSIPTRFGRRKKKCGEGRISKGFSLYRKFQKGGGETRKGKVKRGTREAVWAHGVLLTTAQGPCRPAISNSNVLFQPSPMPSG